MTDEAQAFPPMPPAKGGLCPYLTIEGAMEAAKFYEKALGAETVFAVPPDEQGRTMHVHLYINDASVMLSDPYPDHGHPYEGSKGFTVQLHVDDADQWADRAIAAGCKVGTPVQDMFWGDRWGSVIDPYNVAWAFNAPKKA